MDSDGPSGEGGIRDREQAYRQLEEAARFLLRTEPHSPAPYLVMRAVSWGHMSLGELLAELLPDESNVRHLHLLLGLDQKRSR